MTDNQIIVDIKVNDADLLEASKNVDKLDLSIEDLSKTISNARTQNKNYTKALKDNEKALKEGKITTSEYLKAKNNINIAIQKNNSLIAKNSVDLSKQKRERKAGINMLSKESSAYDKLSTKLNIARRKAKDLAVSFGTNSTQFKKASANVRKMDKSLKKIDKSLGQSQRNVGNYTGALKNMAGAFGLVALAGKGISYLKDSVKMYEAQKLAVQKLNVVVKQRTGATKDEINEILKLTSTQQKLGVVGDEVQIAGAQQIATFVNSTDSIKTLIPAMNNLIVQQKGLNGTQADAVNIANMVGKAFQGQIGALSRVGISFTEAQAKIIKYGNESEKAGVLAQIITDNVGDMNAEFAKTDLGQIQQANNNLGDMQERIGSKLIPIIAKFKQFILGAFENIANFLSGDNVITKGLKLIGNAIMFIVSNLKTLTIAFAVFVIGQKAAALVTALMNGELKSTNISMKNLNKTLKKNLFGLLAAGIAIAVTKLYEFITAQSSAEKEIDNFNSNLIKQQTELNNVFDALKKTEKGSKDRAKLIKVINEKYPNYIGNIDLEQAGLHEIELAQRRANKELAKNLALKSKQKALAGATTDAMKVQTDAISGLIKEATKDNAYLTAQAGKDFGKFFNKIRKSGKVTKAEFGKIVTQYNVSAYEVAKAINTVVKSEKAKNKDLKLINATYSGYLEDENKKRGNSSFDFLNKQISNAKISSKKQIEVEKKKNEVINKKNKDAWKKNADARKKADDNYLKSLDKLRSTAKKINDSFITDVYEKNENERKIELASLDKSLSNLTASQQKKIKQTQNYKDAVLAINEKYDNKAEKLQSDAQAKEKAILDKNEAELLKRKENANEKLKELADKKELDLLERKQKELDIYGATEQEKLAVQDEIDNIFIEQENNKLALQLENEQLTQEERDALKAEHDAKIEEIENNKELKQIEREQANTQRVKDNLNEIQSITEQFAGKENAIFGRVATSLINSFQNGKVSAISALTAISEISRSFSDAEKAQNDAKLTRLEESKQRELDVEGLTDAQKEQINEKYRKRENKVKLEQWKADQKSALTQIAINTALSIAKTFANLGVPAGIPASLLAAGFGILQAGIVASQSPPTFAKGTSDIVNIGDSHASGNDVSVYGYDKKGNSQFFGNVEKGEAMPVIRKSAVNEYLISKLNNNLPISARNKTTYATGTNDITANATQTDTQLNSVELANSIADAMQNVTIITKVEDVTNLQTENILIENNAVI